MFSFDLGRGGAVARSFLGEYAGILQTDGYASYNNAGGPGLVSAGCWAHARRYFVDAVKVNKLDVTPSTSAVGPRPVDGSHPNMTANTMINIRPTQNVGREKPKMEPAMIALAPKRSG